MAFAVPYVASSLGASAATAATLRTVASYASMGMSVLGAIKGYTGAKAEGKANANYARYQAQVSTNNAIIARQNAQMAASEGATDVAQAQAETRARVGAIKAQQAASGIDVNYGSAVDVRSSAAQTGQLNAINIRSAAARKVYGYESQADQFDAEAGLHEAEAQNAKTAAGIKAQSTLLGGLSDAGNNFSNYLNARSPVETITWNS